MKLLQKQIEANHIIQVAIVNLKKKRKIKKSKKKYFRYPKLF